MSSPELPAYLSARTHVFLSPLSTAFLSLVLLLVSLTLSFALVSASVDATKAGLMASCMATQAAASVAVSLPHYMASGLNNLSADSTEATLQGLVRPDFESHFWELLEMC
jgi:NADH:ubiquinone oxidoreductase subunit K